MGLHLKSHKSLLSFYNVFINRNVKWAHICWPGHQHPAPSSDTDTEVCRNKWGPGSDRTLVQHWVFCPCDLWWGGCPRRQEDGSYSQGTPGEGPRWQRAAGRRACGAGRRTGGTRTRWPGAAGGCSRSRSTPEHMEKDMEAPPHGRAPHASGGQAEPTTALPFLTHFKRRATPLAMDFMDKISLGKCLLFMLEHSSHCYTNGFCPIYWGWFPPSPS